MDTLDTTPAAIKKETQDYINTMKFYRVLYMSHQKYRELNSHTLQMGKNLTLKIVNGKDSIPLNKVDDLLWCDIYEGYKKLGRYKLADVRIKFR